MGKPPPTGCSPAQHPANCILTGPLGLQEESWAGPPLLLCSSLKLVPTAVPSCLKLRGLSYCQPKKKLGNQHWTGLIWTLTAAGKNREELLGKEQSLKFSLGSLNSSWPSGLLSPPPPPMRKQPWLSNMLIIRAYRAKREGKVSAKRKVKRAVDRMAKAAASWSSSTKTERKDECSGCGSGGSSLRASALPDIPTGCWKHCFPNPITYAKGNVEESH